MKCVSRHAARAFVAAVALSVTAAVCAQDYPTRDITFIVPFGAGGSADPLARQFAGQLEKVLRGNINVENKPGGSGTIGMNLIARAKPDGYTIGLGSNSMLAYQPLVNKGLSFKTPDDYQPIVKLTVQPSVLFVRADAPWKTFDEFLADVRKNPGKIRASVAGLRQAADLCAQQFNMVAGVKMVTVPFSSGGGEALVALLGGRVEAFVNAGVNALGHVQDGKLRPLAAFMKGKHPLFPSAVSVVDAGYDATLPITFYVVAPKDMPKGVQDKLVTASLQVVGSEEFAKFAKANTYMVDAKGPQALREEILQYTKTYSDLIKFIDQKK
ncbi:MAG: tripartite tricarboxylate transporter substrate binding protein [Betaproteobacteria bacterium]|nr:tripartite tricarboxylate transporter substrate binding protein [Betaproteobacteria bacterium]